MATTKKNTKNTTKMNSTTDFNTNSISKTPTREGWNIEWKGSGLTEKMLSQFKAEGWAWSLRWADEERTDGLAPVWVVLFKHNSKKNTPEGQRFLVGLPEEEARMLESFTKQGLEPVFGMV